MFGDAIIKPLQAELDVDPDEMFEQMDPYAVFQVGNQQDQTDKCKNQTDKCKDGKCKQYWHEIFKFECNGEDTIYFKIKDDMISKDRVIGEGQISLTECFKHGHVVGWFPAYHEGVQCGKIRVDITTISSGNLQKGAGLGMQQGLGTSAQLKTQHDVQDGVNSGMGLQGSGTTNQNLNAN